MGELLVISTDQTERLPKEGATIMAQPRTHLLVAVLLAFFAAIPTSAQTRQYINHRTYVPPTGESAEAFGARAYPGMPVDEKPGWVWGHDGTSWYWEQAQPDPDCLWVNPYADGEKSLECTARYTPPRPPLRQFAVGGRYYRAYPSHKMIVLSIARGIDGVEVVTYQWITMAAPYSVGDVQACRNDDTQTASSCSLWLPIFN